MTRVLRSERFLHLSPLFSAVLFYSFNLGLLMQMWATQSAGGHSPTAWTAAVISQALWVNFYRIKNPGDFWVNTTAWVTMGFLMVMLASVWHFSV